MPALLSTLKHHVFFVMDFLAADHGPFLRRNVKPFLAVVLAALLVFGCACYRSGYVLGSAIHGANDGLAWLVTGYSPVVAPRVVTVSPRVVAVESLTVADLRILARQAGYKRLARSGRKAELIAVLSGVTL